MKQLRLVALVLAASACCVAMAFACGAGKGASASAAGSSCCAGGASATAANAKGKGAKVAAGACTPEMQAACTPEMKAACSANKSAAAGSPCCSGGSMAAHVECAVCADQVGCDEDIRSTGAHTQVVALKNGAMIVYTANTPENVRALQATVARHNSTVVSVLNGQRDGKLCASCKPMRGAMQSGKLHRELVNVQRGAQVVITSSDRSMVRRIHDMTGAELAARVRD